MQNLDPSRFLALIFSPRFSKFVTRQAEFFFKDGMETKFYLSGLNLTMETPSLKIKKTSRYAIGMSASTFNFYRVEEYTTESFTGERLNTHIDYILQPSEIHFLRGYLYAIYQKEQLHEKP